MKMINLVIRKIPIGELGQKILNRIELYYPKTKDLYHTVSLKINPNHNN